MNAFRPLRYALLVLFALVAQGCGKESAKTVTVKAEKAVEEFLDAWSKGESLDRFESDHPRISASDPEWKAGMRLLSFLSVDTKIQEDMSLCRCRFALSLRDGQGKTVDKQVVYEVVPGKKYVISRAQY
jgi:hypothetical protein